MTALTVLQKTNTHKTQYDYNNNQTKWFRRTNILFSLRFSTFYFRNEAFFNDFVVIDVAIQRMSGVGFSFLKQWRGVWIVRHICISDEQLNEGWDVYMMKYGLLISGYGNCNERWYLFVQWNDYWAVMRIMGNAYCGRCKGIGN